MEVKLLWQAGSDKVKVNKRKGNERKGSNSNIDKQGGDNKDTSLPLLLLPLEPRRPNRPPIALVEEGIQLPPG